MSVCIHPLMMKVEFDSRQAESRAIIMNPEISLQEIYLNFSSENPQKDTVSLVQG